MSAAARVRRSRVCSGSGNDDAPVDDDEDDDDSDDADPNDDERAERGRGDDMQESEPIEEERG